MFELLIYTIVFVVGYMGFIKALWVMMQPRQAFDIVSSGKWSAWLDKLYIGRPYQKLLTKILGGCEQCGAFWFSILWAVLYAVFNTAAKVWLYSNVANVIWCVLFICLCSYFGFLAIKPKEDGV